MIATPREAVSEAARALPLGRILTELGGRVRETRHFAVRGVVDHARSAARINFGAAALSAGYRRSPSPDAIASRPCAGGAHAASGARKS
jgi:hypothetical protein